MTDEIGALQSAPAFPRCRIFPAISTSTAPFIVVSSDEEEARISAIAPDSGRQWKPFLRQSKHPFPSSESGNAHFIPFRLSVSSWKIVANSRCSWLEEVSKQVEGLILSWGGWRSTRRWGYHGRKGFYESSDERIVFWGLCF